VLVWLNSTELPLLRMEPEGFCTSIYKHATPHGVKPMNSFQPHDVEKPPGQIALSSTLTQKQEVARLCSLTRRRFCGIMSEIYRISKGGKLCVA
jgi:hypothetical protein